MYSLSSLVTYFPSSITSSLTCTLNSLTSSFLLSPHIFIIFLTPSLTFLMHSQSLPLSLQKLIYLFTSSVNNWTHTYFLSDIFYPSLCVSPGFVPSGYSRYFELWRLPTSQTSQLLLSSLTLPPWSAPTAKVLKPPTLKPDAVNKYVTVADSVVSVRCVVEVRFRFWYLPNLFQQIFYSKAVFK